MPHKSSPRTLEIPDPSWGQWWSTGAVHVKCTGPRQRAAAASPTPTPATVVSELPWLPYGFSEQTVCLLQFRESWGLLLEFSFFFFCIFILIIISVCWWRVGHITTAPVWRPEDTFRKSVLSFHPGLWRWNSGHQTCEQAPNYLASSDGSLWSSWVDIFLAPKVTLSISIMYNFSHGFHSEWLSLSICYDSVSKMGYDLGCCLGS